MAIVPQLRNAVLEWPREDRFIFYLARRSELDEGLAREVPGIMPFGWRALASVIADPSVGAIEVAEPMWAREWPKMLPVLAFVRVWRFLTGGSPMIVGAYAIENLGWRERFLIPGLDRFPRINGAVASAIRRIYDMTALLFLDVLVFGTGGARQNYQSSLPHSFLRLRHRSLDYAMELCACVDVHDRDRPGSESRPVVVQFLGESAARKGVDILLRAWGLVRGESGSADWVLQLTGPGCESVDVGGQAGIRVEGPIARQLVYQRLGEAAVVVLPSRRWPRWREQVGLPIVEGLQHGCAVVATTETGLAAELAGRADVWLVPPDDVVSLARAISAAGRAPAAQRTCRLNYEHIDDLRVRLWGLLEAELAGVDS